MGQPLAEPATAAGGALFQRRQPRQLGPGSLSSARAGRQARQPRVSQGPGRLPERAPQAKTHSHHHRLQQALDHAPAVRHRRQAPQAALPHLGQPRPQFGGAGRPPVLQSDEFRQSSLGVYRTAETYQGKHGYSLRLDGLSPGKNSNARKRAIVVHGADYASPRHLQKFDKLGRSWGCPALPREQSRAIIDTIKGGSVIYAHG